MKQADRGYNPTRSTQNLKVQEEDENHIRHPLYKNVRIEVIVSGVSKGKLLAASFNKKSLKQVTALHTVLNSCCGAVFAGSLVD